VQYIDAEFNVFDGAHVQHNCTDVNRAQFSYNSAILLQGAAFMYNYTGATGKAQEQGYWKAEIDGLLGATLRVFFPNGTAFEPACEAGMTCTSDMLSFKGYVHRWMAVTAQLATYTRQTIMPVLRTSAQSAVRTCAGGTNGRMCGFKWAEAAAQGTGWDGTLGAGQQMNVLGALSSLLTADAGTLGIPPVTNTTGGTSGGDSSAGYGHGSPWLDNVTPITTADRAGAGILTAITLISIVGIFWWMLVDETSSRFFSRY
jgi:mannan endo-1,6-alpha-mannosidase